MDKTRIYDRKKPKLNRVKEISILAWSITERKPHMRGSGEKKTLRNAKPTSKIDHFPTWENVK
jgi:hypothetical protein